MSDPVKDCQKWQPFNAECNYCGGSAEVFTDTGRENWANDGDAARCSECHCPGVVVVSEEPDAYINWHDEPDCKCDWCISHPVE